MASLVTPCRPFGPRCPVYLAGTQKSPQLPSSVWLVPRTDQRAECRAKFGGYADDLHVAGRSVEDVERAHCITELWTAGLYMKLNPPKCHSLGGASLAIGPVPLTPAHEAKLLGDHLVFDGSLTAQALWLDSDRVSAFCRRLARIMHYPGNKDFRLELVAISAIPLLYGSECEDSATASSEGMGCRAGRGQASLE